MIVSILSGSGQQHNGDLDESISIDEFIELKQGHRSTMKLHQDAKVSSKSLKWWQMILSVVSALRMAHNFLALCKLLSTYKREDLQ